MLDLKAISTFIAQIAEEKDLDKEQVKEVVEQALASAYKKELGLKNQKVEAELDTSSGKVNFFKVLQVVDPSQILTPEELEEIKQKREKGEEVDKKDKIRFDPKKHILLEDAQKIDPKAQPGDKIKIPLESKVEFGRIAAQTAKQVITQGLKELEKLTLLKEFKEKEGEIVSGIVQRVEEKGVYFDLGRATGIMLPKDQIPGERYEIGKRLKLYLLKVEEDTQGPKIFLSRSHPKFVSKLFELEVPEIQAGQVEIKSIAREPGSRTKMAVFSHQKEIDPVGSCIGQRGSRVGAVLSELGQEKVDIIAYSDKEEEFIKNALAPAKVKEVKLDKEKNRALALVEKDQLSLAIGKDGQNVRLASKLTGWKIDVETIT